MSIVKCDACHREVELETVELNGIIYHLCAECLDRVTALCPICGKRHLKRQVRRVIYVDTVSNKRVTLDYVCEDCYTKQFFQCRECGETYLREVQTIVKRSVKPVCPRCLELYYSKCEKCGKYHRKYELVSIDGSEFCTNCLVEMEYFKCAHCGEWHKTEDGDSINGYFYCNSCLERRETCPICGVKQFSVSEHDGLRMCDNCYEDLSYIANYEHTRNLKFRQLPSEREINNLKYFGLEVELESQGGINSHDLAMHLRDEQGEAIKKDFQIKYDGSLNNGFEMVTNPISKLYFDRMNIEGITKTLTQWGGRSHNTDTCGLHVHVNRNFFENDVDAFAKLVILFDRFWDDIVKFSRRDIDCLERWAKKNPLCNDDTSETYSASEYDRYHAINNSNSTTLEFRIFRGTLNPTTIRACIEFVNCLTDFVNVHSVDECIKSTWQEIFSNADEHFNNYVAGRNLEV